MTYSVIRDRAGENRHASTGTRRTGSTMSEQTRVPGLRNQRGVRTGLRVGGAVALVVGLALVVAGGLDFFGSMNGPQMPTKFWMFMVGLPVLAVGGFLLQAGFAGVGARYAAGEYAPVVKDAASYLTAGRGVVGAGRTAPESGPYCRSCGTRNDAEARFCDGCGAPMA